MMWPLPLITLVNHKMMFWESNLNHCDRVQLFSTNLKLFYAVKFVQLNIYLIYKYNVNDILFSDQAIQIDIFIVNLSFGISYIPDVGEDVVVSNDHTYRGWKESSLSCNLPRVDEGFCIYVSDRLPAR